MWPVRDPETDLALKIRIELLAEVVSLVGTERFMEAVKQAIRISHSRYDCSVRKIRECAGLRWQQEPLPAMRAWEFVTQVVARHVRPAPAGGYHLEPWYHLAGEGVTIVEVPLIPDSIQRAVNSIGGWAALAQTDAAYWGQRLRDFRDVYSEDPNPYMDRKPEEPKQL